MLKLNIDITRPGLRRPGKVVVKLTGEESTLTSTVYLRRGDGVKKIVRAMLLKIEGHLK